ncbi:hypothetical protein SK128_026362 [Halocaridina rubra]|uniref:Uncharacterized protein n=1 Tax=Halocaridina rubra TaxID=373956 RepID=A0AAN8XEF0_HALRR
MVRSPAHSSTYVVAVQQYSTIPVSLRYLLISSSCNTGKTIRSLLDSKNARQSIQLQNMDGLMTLRRLELIL